MTATGTKTRTAEPLARVLARRLGVVAILVLILQTVYIVWDYSQQGSYLAATAVEDELQALMTAAQHANATGTIRDMAAPASIVAERYASYPSGKGFELSDATGSVLVAVNPDVLRNIPVETGGFSKSVDREDTLDGVERYYASKAFALRGKPFRLRVAFAGDPGHGRLKVLMEEVVDHVSLPAIPLVLLMLATAWFVLRRTLRPLEAAAAEVTKVTDARDTVHLELAGAPAEVVSLGSAVNRLLDRLHEALDAQRDFAANVAHELRTPLSLLTLELSSMGEPAARRAHADAQKMASLITQLLAMAQLEGLDARTVRPVDLSGLAKGTIAKLAPIAIAEGRQIEFVAAGPVKVNGQPDTIESALRNLLENALRVTPSGGTVRVKAGPDAALRVFDEGPGIPAGEEEAIFKRFHQADRKAQGTAGLGLAIVHRTMELHGGSARASNIEGGGACFVLDFSTADKRPAAASPIGRGEA